MWEIFFSVFRKWSDLSKKQTYAELLSHLTEVSHVILSKYEHLYTLGIRLSEFDGIRVVSDKWFLD